MVTGGGFEFIVLIFNKYYTDLILRVLTFPLCGAEEERVLFLKAIVDAMNTKAQIKLNSKKLYSADGYAVKELLKISTLLYQSMRHNQQLGMNGQTQDEGLDVVIGVKPEDTKLMRTLASEVVSIGAVIHDVLSREVDLRDARTKSAARQLDTDEVERSIKMTIRSTNENVNTLSEKLDNLASDEANLDTKIEKKKDQIWKDQKPDLRACKVFVQHSWMNMKDWKEN